MVNQGEAENRLPEDRHYKEYWGEYGVQILRALGLPENFQTRFDDLKKVVATYYYSDPAILRQKLALGQLPIAIQEEFFMYFATLFSKFGTGHRFEGPDALISDPWKERTISDNDDYYEIARNKGGKVEHIKTSIKHSAEHLLSEWRHEKPLIHRDVLDYVRQNFSADLSPEQQEMLYELELQSTERVEEDYEYLRRESHRGCSRNRKGVKYEEHEKETLEEYQKDYLEWWEAMQTRRNASSFFLEFIEEEFEYIRDHKTPLTEKLLHGIPHTPNAIQVMEASGMPHGELEMNYGHRNFAEHGRLKSALRYSEGDEELLKAIEQFIEGLDNDRIKRNGSVLMDESTGEYQIRLGIRRIRRPKELDIIKGLHLFDHLADEWRCKNPTPDFYESYFGPQFKNEKESQDPMIWAAERLKVMIGFSLMCGATFDYPPYAQEFQFKRMAPIACNSTPEHLLKPRIYKMTDKRQALYDKVLEHFEGANPAEVTDFVFKNANTITPEMLDDPEVIDLLKKLQQHTEKGLIITRVSTFFLKNLRGNKNAKAALIYTLKIVDNIFMGNEPWWFKEDFSLTQAFNYAGKKLSTKNDKLEIPNNQNGREIVERISEKMGFGFEYGLEVYKRAGYKMAHVAGMGQNGAIDFTCRITNSYGIGNIQRAVNIIEYAIGHIEEVAPEERKRSLKMFEKYVLGQGPRSPLIGRLEGGDTTFKIPGLSSLLVSVLGPEKPKDVKKFDEVSLTMDHIRKFVKPIGLPLIERAKIPPALIGRRESTKMLRNENSSLLALTRPENAQTLPSKLERPSNSIFALLEQCRREVGYVDNDLLRPYFAMLAVKMKDPLAPPSGFFKFLKKYKEIPNPAELAALNERIFSHPRAYGRRERASNSEAQAHVDRWMILIGILDANILGMISDSSLQRILDWVVKDPSEKERKIAHQRAKEELKYQKEHVERNIEEDGEGKRFTKEDEKRFIRMRTERYSKKMFGEEKWIKRVESLQHMINIIVALNTFVKLNIISAQELLTFVELLSKSLLRGKLPKTHLPFMQKISLLNEEGAKAFFDKLKEIAELGIFDSSKFFETLEDANTIGRKLLEIENLMIVVDLFNQSKNIIQICEREIMKTYRPMHNYNLGEEHERGKQIEVTEVMKQKLAELWGHAAYVSPDVVGILLTKFFNVPRWREVIEIARTVNEKVIVEAGVGEIGIAMREINQLSLGVIAASFADTMMGEKGNGRFPVIPKKSIIDIQAQRRRRILPSSMSRIYSFDSLGGNEEVIGPKRKKHGELVRIPSGSEMEGVLGQIIGNADKMKDIIRKAREECIGFVPVGGKIHFLHPVDGRTLEQFKRMASFQSTPFHLIHAQESMILPPKPSFAEMQMLVFMLQNIGLIDAKYPELQLTAPGHLSKINAAISAMAILLSTDLGTTYNEEAFTTNQNHATGSRIMTYDHYIPTVKLPFMSGVDGRTDKLGSRSVTDFEDYQFIHTILLHGQLGKGPFRSLSEPFVTDFRRILAKPEYGLEGRINKNWIFDNSDRMRRDMKGAKEHFQDVSACTDAYFACEERYKETQEEVGIIFEVRDLIAQYRNIAREIQKNLLSDPNTCKEREYLFNI